MQRVLLAATVLVAVLPLSGCFGSGSDDFDFVPGTKFKETGNTVHLKASVADYDSEVYPGLNTWLWAFCFEPVDPSDTYSANAIEGWVPLPGDKVVGSNGDELTEKRGVCSVPGPTLRVKQGDRVIVEFSNSHFHPHTIHWHGQFVDWESDGAPGVTQDSVVSGSSFTYNFIAKRAGTLWYHCHVDTQMHVQQGLYGMMIVEPQDKTYEPKGIDREYNIVLSTMNRNTVEAIGTSRHSHPAGCASGFPEYNGVPCENPSSQAGKPDVFLINGHSYPYTMDQEQSLIVMKEGERIRLRIGNFGETVEELHPHGHDMLVTHKDGNPLPPSARYYVDTLTVGPAERYDVVIVADNPGPWMIHTHVNSHETNCGKAPGGMHTMLVYEDFLDKMHQFKAEAPVDCPRGETLELPGDFSNQTTLQQSSATPGLVPGTAQWNAGTWTWPIQLPCAVREMAFYGRVIQDASVRATNPAQVTFRVFEPNGDTAYEFTTGSTTPNPATAGSPPAPAAYVLKQKSLGNLTQVPGDYRLEVTGYGMDVQIELDVRVDYYESFEQSKVGHLTYSVGGCSGYT